MRAAEQEHPLVAEALRWRAWATGERKDPPHNLLAFTSDVVDAVAELQAAQEREKMAYAVILNALDPHRGGYRSTALDRLRRFARGRSGLTDDEAAALAAQRTESVTTEEPSDDEGLEPIETSPLTEREPDL